MTLRQEIAHLVKSHYAKRTDLIAILYRSGIKLSEARRGLVTRLRENDESVVYRIRTQTGTPQFAILSRDLATRMEAILPKRPWFYF